MLSRKPNGNGRSAPVAVGTGLIALDVVFGEDMMSPIGRWAGGTCGNVMTILSFLGWESCPIARLGKNDDADRLLADLKRWNVRQDFIRCEPKGSTPVIIEYIRRNSGDGVTHRFSLRCPICGTRLPGYRPVTLAVVEPVAEELKHPKVFFFDRVSPAALALARVFADRGAVVVFEPSSMGDERQFARAVSVSHVVKYSHERLCGVGVRHDAMPLLEIETRGAAGLRYRSRLPNCATAAWRTISPFEVKDLRDSAGAGDWCTAGIIKKLAWSGLAGFMETSTAELCHAFSYGQAVAAWSCSFDSPRGGMYDVRKAEFEEQVAKILDSRSIASIPGAPARIRRQRQGKTHSHLCATCRAS